MTHILSTPVNRIDGHDKVTGAATYAADFALSDMTYGRLVTTAAARGRVTRIDTDAAMRVPGALHVLTHDNMPEIAALESFYAGGPLQSSFVPLTSTEIRYAGQPVALVVAETLEAAREAAARVAVTVEAEPANADIFAENAEAKPAPSPAPTDVGDADDVLSSAAVAIEADYTTPVQHHNPMELFSATAEWSEDDQLTLYTPSQWVKSVGFGVAAQLGIPAENVRVRSPYVGGAFGSKGSLSHHVTLTSIAARHVGRPVKLYVTRQQMYTVASFRPASQHTISLGAERDGTLTAFKHVQRAQTSRFDDVVHSGIATTTRMYRADAIHGHDELIPVDTNSPGFMRAPNEVPAMFAVESAVDELAEELGIDPVELRLKNDTDHDPVTGVPFSSRSLRQCLERGADLFGWHDRDAAIGSMRANDELIGYGVATATYPTMMMPSSARVRLDGEGRARVQVAAHDVGTGAYTAAAIVAAETLGLPVERIEVELGDSVLPAGPISGGSMTTAGMSSAIQKACRDVRDQVLAAAVAKDDGPLAGENVESLDVEDGVVRGSNGRSVSLPELVAAMPGGVAEVETGWHHPKLSQKKVDGFYQGNLAMAGPVTDSHAMFSFGAEFVEVRVNRHTRSIRVPRMVGVFAAGTIVNAKAAASQVEGGMIWGLSSALHEETVIDPATARFVNANVAEYLMPVNADIPEVTTEFVEEHDEIVNPLGIKGIGELGIVGTAAAVANAVRHATGVRLRSLPIRMEHLVTARQARR